MPPSVTDKPPAGAVPAPGLQCGPEPPVPALAPQSAPFPEFSAQAQDPTPFSESQPVPTGAPSSSAPATDAYRPADPPSSIFPADDRAATERNAALFHAAAPQVVSSPEPKDAREFLEWLRRTEERIDRFREEAYLRLKGREITLELFDEVVLPVVREINAALREGRHLFETLRVKSPEADVDRVNNGEWHDARSEWNVVQQIGELWRSTFVRESRSQLSGLFRPEILFPLKTLQGELWGGWVFSASARLAGVDLRILDIPPAIADLSLDPARGKQLGRILTNLIINGVKYHNPTVPPGQRFVELGAELVGGAVGITVADNGRGMTPEELSHYGEERWRSPEVKEAGISGDGIGSGNVIRLVREFGGAFEITSEKGKGTRAVVTIPLQALAATEEQAVAALVRVAEEAAPAIPAFLLGLPFGGSPTQEEKRINADSMKLLSMVAVQLTIRAFNGDWRARRILQGLAAADAPLAGMARNILAHEGQLLPLMWIADPLAFAARVLEWEEEVVRSALRTPRNDPAPSFSEVRIRQQDVLGPPLVASKLFGEFFRGEGGPGNRQSELEIGNHLVSMVGQTFLLLSIQPESAAGLIAEPWRQARLGERPFSLLWPAAFFAGFQRVAMSVEFPSGLRWGPGFDPSDAERALGELAFNAVKYHGPADGRGERFVRVAFEGGAFVVSDNGPGIENLARIFERGYREDWRFPKILPGPWFGLADVKRVLEGIGWRIEVVSRLGEGTTFTITPKPGDVVAEGKPSGAPAPASPQGAAAGGAAPSSAPQGGGTLQGKMASGVRGPGMIFGGDLLRGAAILDRSGSFGLLLREASRKRGLLPAISAHHVPPPPPMMPFTPTIMPFPTLAPMPGAAVGR